MPMFVLVCVMLGGQAVRQKSYIYCLSFHKTKFFFVWHLHSTWHDMSAGQALLWSIDTWVYLASWLFSHILSWQCYHLFVFHYCLPLYHLKLFCLHSCPLPCGLCFACLFIMYVLAVIVIVLGDLLLEYDCGLILMCSRIASSGSVCLC